jgi:hypothetical protein
MKSDAKPESGFQEYWTQSKPGIESNDDCYTFFSLKKKKKNIYIPVPCGLVSELLAIDPGVPGSILGTTKK